MDVLAYLIEHHDRVVSADELLDHIWPDRVVEQSSIHRRINQLRQALGDDPKTPTYIRTIVRRGYQAIAPVAPATGNTVEKISITTRPLLSAFAALVVIVVAVVVIWSYLRTLPGVSAVPMVREQLNLENWIQGPTRNPGNITPTIAMSFRGDSIAFVSRTEQGASGLSLRRLRELEAELIPGTEGADKPFFSPDGKWIGYFVGPTMMRIATSGGEPFEIMKLNRDSWGASWGSDYRIVFADTTTGLTSVSLQGDDMVKLTALDEPVGEYSHRLPRHLHGYDSLLFTVYNQELGQQIWVLDFKTGERRYLFDGVAASYVDPGFIVYTKIDENLSGQLWYVPFDPKALTVTGQPRLVHGAMGGYMGTAFAASQAGPLVILPRQGRLVGELVIRERDGSERILDPEARSEA